MEDSYVIRIDKDLMILINEIIKSYKQKFGIEIEIKEASKLLASKFNK